MDLNHPTLLEIGNRPEIQKAVGDLYAQFQHHVSQRKPLCRQSGNCCRFQQYGHRLYVTTIELALFATRLESISHSFAPTPGACPFQQNNLCTVHSIRPFGCQVFFCDPTATDWQQSQYEHFHTQLKQLHHQFNIPYRYIEWLTALEHLNLATDSSPPTSSLSLTVLR